MSVKSEDMKSCMAPYYYQQQFAPPYMHQYYAQYYRQVVHRVMKSDGSFEQAQQLLSPVHESQLQV